MLLTAALGACSHHNVVADSISKLNDSKRFTTTARGAQTVADISTRLRLAGAACRKSHHDAPRCTLLLQAAAYAAVTAYTMADCTAPGVFDGRKAMLGYLHAIHEYKSGALPTVPKVTTC